MMSYLHNFALAFCVDLVTPESLWRHKSVAMHVTYNPCIAFLQCMIRLLPLRNFPCKFRLRNVWKPNNWCHNRDLSRMYRALWDWKHSGANRILVAHSYLRSCNARYIMLKSLKDTKAKWTIHASVNDADIVSDDGLTTRCHSIVWMNGGLLATGSLRTNKISWLPKFQTIR